MNNYIYINVIFCSVLSNIWHVSDDGSDDNYCHSASAPCRNLQTVLDRAADGADIYVTSNTLSLDYDDDDVICEIKSSLSYTLMSYHNTSIKVTCSGIYFYLLLCNFYHLGILNVFMFYEK